jgi:hypothetical protein
LSWTCADHGSELAQILQLLQSIDFVVIREIEKSVSLYPSSSLCHPPKGIEHWCMSACGTVAQFLFVADRQLCNSLVDIQRRVFEFVCTLLQDEDRRVSQTAARILPTLLCNLCVAERYRDGGGLTRSELVFYDTLHWFQSEREVNERFQDRANGNLLWALPYLVRGSNIVHHIGSPGTLTAAVGGPSLIGNNTNSASAAPGQASSSSPSNQTTSGSATYGFFRAFAELAKHSKNNHRSKEHRGHHRLRVHMHAREMILSGLENCINGTITDIDINEDILLCSANLFQVMDSPALSGDDVKDNLYKLWKPVSSHVLKILNIIVTAMRTAEVGIRERLIENDNHKH